MDVKEQFIKCWQVLIAFPIPILINTLLLLGVSVVTLGIMAPVASAGYMQSFLEMMRNDRPPEPKDLFAYMELLFPLFGLGLVLAVLAGIGFTMLFLPGILVVLAASFFLLYLLPLMTDQQLGIVDAVKESISMSLEDPISEQVIVVAVVMALHVVGDSIAIGILFSLPFSCLYILTVFEERGTRLLSDA